MTHVYNTKKSFLASRYLPLFFIWSKRAISVRSSSNVDVYLGGCLRMDIFPDLPPAARLRRNRSASRANFSLDCIGNNPRNTSTYLSSLSRIGRMAFLSFYESSGREESVEKFLVQKRIFLHESLLFRLWGTPDGPPA